MGIEGNDRTGFDVVCDGCGAVLVEDLETFHEAVDWKKENKHLLQNAKSREG